MQMTSDELRDLANKRQALRIRIHEDEQRLAMAYAGEEERLTQNLEHHRALLSTLDKRLGEAKDEARRQVRESIEAFYSRTCLRASSFASPRRLSRVERRARWCSRFCVSRSSSPAYAIARRCSSSAMRMRSA